MAQLMIQPAKQSAPQQPAQPKADYAHMRVNLAVLMPAEGETTYFHDRAFKLEKVAEGVRITSLKDGQKRITPWHNIVWLDEAE